MDYVADTTFLVGLWRRQSWAVAFARKESGRSLGLPWVVLGEFWHGATAGGHDPQRVESFLRLGIPLLDPTPVIPVYARLCAELQRSNAYRAVGQNDLWIAATALASNRPLVTRNRRHFHRIAGLQLEALTED
jgi:tRNA(fMet)-specific endonuclease VapC